MELATAGTVVGLLSAILKAVDLIRTAREDCKDAPRLTRQLLDRIIGNKKTLESINKTVVSNSHPENLWDDLKPVLNDLKTVIVAVGEDNMVKYLDQDQKRKSASEVLEIWKSLFQRGAAKHKKATQETLKQIDSLVGDLDLAVNAHVLSTVMNLGQTAGCSGSPRGRQAGADLWGQKLLSKLHTRAVIHKQNELLQDIHLEVERERGKFGTPQSNQLVIAPWQEDETSDSTVPSSAPVHRGRASGIRVPNSTKIRFRISMRGNRLYFFHVVTCDVHDKTSVSPKTPQRRTTD